MGKRVVKNTVRYIDRHIAIVDLADTNQTALDVALWLLKVGTNHENESKPLREFLERCTFWPQHSLSIPNLQSADLDNPKLVESLGFSLSNYEGQHGSEGGRIDPPRLNVQKRAGGSDSESARYCVDLRHIIEAAENARYFSRLTLLALGDERAADAIRLLETSSDKLTLNFDALVPTTLLGDFDTVAEANDSLHYVDVMTSKPRDNNRAIRFSCMMDSYNYYHHDLTRKFPSDELSRKTIAANVLLSVLLNGSMGVSFLPNPESGLPERKETANMLTLIVELAKSGQLVGCPYCGWPVVVPHRSSDPYCRKSHRTRTDEKRAE